MYASLELEQSLKTSPHDKSNRLCPPYKDLSSSAACLHHDWEGMCHAGAMGRRCVCAHVVVESISLVKEATYGWAVDIDLISLQSLSALSKLPAHAQFLHIPPFLATRHRLSIAAKP